MEPQVSQLLSQYESGRISRRQLVAGITGLAAMMAGSHRATGQEADPKETPSEPTFQATGLNHLALRVSNVPQSREFYVRHLGLKVTRDNGERSCFLDCGKHFVALFRGEPGMDHYCYSINDYNVDECEEKLKAEGFEPRVVRPDGRIYFKDPDGLTVQLAQMPK